jgi:hypothetical protein
MLRAGAVAATVMAACVVAAASLEHRDADADDNRPTPIGAPATVSVSPRSGRAVPSGFIGISFEYPAVMQYAGGGANAVNPLLPRLILNLVPGQRPVIRIGGDSTDTTWWPVPDRQRPGGVTYTLSRRWLAVVRSLADETAGKLILGIDMEAGSPPLAAAEAEALINGLGRRVEALEPGNEPFRYGLFPWYQDRRHRLVWARPRSYGFGAFNAEFAATTKVLPRRVPVAGPTLGGRAWMDHLPRFLAMQPGLALVTYHSYPLNRCFTPPSASTSATVAHLLSRRSSRGLAGDLTGYVSTAREFGLPLRVDELNSVACGGKLGVSDTFASALWVLDTLFAMARAGVQGVNIHTFPGAAYGLFNFHQVTSQWRASVSPEYYGLLAFAHATPSGSRLLRLTLGGSPAIRAWATRDGNGAIHVVLIDTDAALGHVVHLRVRALATTGRIGWLQASGPQATRGVTLGGAHIAPTTGRLTAPSATPLTRSSPGSFQLMMPPASAAIVTLAHR